MTHFIQLPNKTVNLLDHELALKNGNMTFEFGGTEKVLVTQAQLQDAMAGMSAPVTVDNLTERDALNSSDLESHTRVFVKDDGDGKWAYYLATDVSATKPVFTKISDADIFGALFSDNVTAQVSKIGELSDLSQGAAAATIIEAINKVYAAHVASNTRVGENANLVTDTKSTVVGAVNELKVRIDANDADNLVITNNIGDKTTINLASADRGTIVAALNKIIAVQAIKIDAQDAIPIIIGYTGLLTNLTTTHQNSLVDAINEVVATATSNHTAVITITGALADLVTTNKTNLVAAINEVQGNVVSETAARIAADNTLQSAITALEAAVGGDTGDLNDLTTDAKGTIVAAINEVDAHTDTNAANLAAEVTARTAAVTAEETRAKAAEAANTTAITNEVTRAKAAEAANTSAINALASQASTTTGTLSDLTTDSKGNVIVAINEVDAHSDANETQITNIKAFLNDMIAKSGKTINGIDLVANTVHSIVLTDLATSNVTVAVYSVDGVMLNQESGLIVKIDTSNNTLKITSSTGITVKVVITSDISSLSIS